MFSLYFNTGVARIWRAIRRTVEALYRLKLFAAAARLALAVLIAQRALLALLAAAPARLARAARLARLTPVAPAVVLAAVRVTPAAHLALAAVRALVAQLQ